MVDQRRFDNQPWLEARAAARLLGVQLRTLYAYTSRGLVRSVAGTRPRMRLYARDDLDRLLARSGARAGHGAVAAGALRWGEPVLDSAVTEITPDGPAYRGHLALALAGAGVSFENVAELLWSDYLPVDPVRWPRARMSATRSPLGVIARLGDVVPPGARPLEVMALLVPLAALADPARADGRPDAIIARCRALVPLLAAALCWTAGAPTPAVVARALSAGTIAAIAARALGLPASDEPILDAALVALADHELNASSFAARIAASTGADPYACFAAALATLSGPRHGSAVEAVAAYADELGAPERAAHTVAARIAAGEPPPGFGHPLYPNGDPRGVALLEAARGSRHRRARAIVAIADAVARASVTLHPSVDVGLAAFVASRGLRPAAGSGLFAVARSAGWLAHALEQRAAGYLLRPRARYIGVSVEATLPAAPPGPRSPTARAATRGRAR